jgi:hypothetical protein
MASSSFSSANHGHACVFRYLRMRCRCGAPADVKISTTGRNPNKLFYGCSSKCGFVDWAHPLNCPCPGRNGTNTTNVAEVEEVEDTASVSDAMKTIESRLLLVEREVSRASFLAGEMKGSLRLFMVMFTAMTIMMFIIFMLVVTKLA